MSIDRKAHARVGGATLVVLVALLLVGSRGKATAEQPTAPAAATPAAPQQQRINPYGDHDGFRHRGLGGGGVPPTTPAPGTDTI
jgi:hypothetical protein